MNIHIDELKLYITECNNDLNTLGNVNEHLTNQEIRDVLTRVVYRQKVIFGTAYEDELMKKFD